MSLYIYASLVQPMSNVTRIVNTESNGKDDADAGDDVNGDAPEVKEADEVNKGE